MSLRRNLTRKTTKRSKKSVAALALVILALAIAAITYAVIFKFDFSASYSDQNLPSYEPLFSVAKITEHPAGASDPRVVDIPAINLRAPIVAQESSSTVPLIVPSTSNVVAWDKTSANLDSTPGVTTLVGHTKASGGNGIFNELYKLQVGNPIYVERGTGARDRYVIRRLETTPWQSLSRSTLLNPEDPSRHGLVIAGVVGANGQASDVLIFYAVKQ